MVSWLPWRGESSSTASFEKTLSALSVKITASQTQLDKLRASSRRIKVLSTIYLSFAYLVYAIVAFLVIGTQELGQVEWAGVVSGPFLIYGVRKILSAFYNYRIETLSSRLKGQQNERAKTIQKLKDATKYDSTMELIEKYGGSAGSSRSKSHGEDDEIEANKGKAKKQKQSNNGSVPGRTTMPPPPTANIQRREPPTPGSLHPASPDMIPHDPMKPTAEFAPNAGAPPLGPQMPSQHTQDPSLFAPPPSYETGNWYDRIFDVLLGEDETAPKNRIVLLCESCRLVNGQAPPGTRSLAELGLWRCMSCGSANGAEKEDEGRRIVREVLGDTNGPVESGQSEAEGEVSESDPTEVEAQSIEETPEAGLPSAVRRRHGKGKN